jgi:putative flippase GtrA
MLAHQEKAKIFGIKVPLYLWFVLSGAICDVFQAFIDYGISVIYVSGWEKATVCWTLSYIISIWIRHFSHRILVFGEYEGTYLSSLTRTYLTYSSSIVISMVTNHLIVKYMLFTHRQAWVFTMLWTGIYNYFMLKASWKGAPSSDKDSGSANIV